MISYGCRWINAVEQASEQNCKTVYVRRLMIPLLKCSERWSRRAQKG